MSFSSLLFRLSARPISWAKIACLESRPSASSLHDTLGLRLPSRLQVAAESRLRSRPAVARDSWDRNLGGVALHRATLRGAAGLFPSDPAAPGPTGTRPPS